MTKKVAIFNDTSVTRHFGCTAVMTNLANELESRNVDIEYRWPVAVDWQPYVDDLKSRPVDAIVVNGEGSIHHSLDRPRARQLCGLGQFFHQELGIPVFLINASLQSLEKNEIENLKLFDFISVRETGSQSYLAQHSIKSIVAGDLSFLTRGPSPRQREGIIVTDSVYKNVTEQLELFAKRNNVPLMPMRSKASFIQKMKKKLNFSTNLPLNKRHDLSLELELTKFLHSLSGAESIVTGRFHSVCLGLVTQTPFLAVQSNTDKISSILYDVFGNTSRMISLDDLTDLKPRDINFTWSKNELLSIDQYLIEKKIAQAGVLDLICS